MSRNWRSVWQEYAAFVAEEIYYLIIELVTSERTQRVDRKLVILGEAGLNPLIEVLFQLYSVHAKLISLEQADKIPIDHQDIGAELRDWLGLRSFESVRGFLLPKK